MHISKAILRELPKSELHLHLRGAMPIRVFAEFVQKYSRETVWRDMPVWRRRQLLHSPNIRRFLSRETVGIEDIREFFDD